jgi:origin recognition complex subunit 5
MLHTAGTPHIHFPAYTRDEAIRILSLTPPRIFPDELPPDYTPDQHTEDMTWLWPRFCAAIWDSLSRNTARDVLSFRELADKLWPHFTISILDGTHSPREFSKVLVARRALFQDEDVLIERVVPKPSTTNDTGIVKGMTPALSRSGASTYIIPKPLTTSRTTANTSSVLPISPHTTLRAQISCTSHAALPP